MLTWNSSPPAFSRPIRYFLLASEALCVTWKERGVLASKNERRISLACFLEQFREEEMTVTSKLSANQLERDAASPAARYFVMEENTEYSPEVFCGRVLLPLRKNDCPAALTQKNSASATVAI